MDETENGFKIWISQRVRFIFFKNKEYVGETIESAKKIIIDAVDSTFIKSEDVVKKGFRLPWGKK